MCFYFNYLLGGVGLHLRSYGDWFLLHGLLFSLFGVRWHGRWSCRWCSSRDQLLKFLILLSELSKKKKMKAFVNRFVEVFAELQDVLWEDPAIPTGSYDAHSQQQNNPPVKNESMFSSPYSWRSKKKAVKRVKCSLDSKCREKEDWKKEMWRFKCTLQEYTADHSSRSSQKPRFCSSTRNKGSPIKKHYLSCSKSRFLIWWSSSIFFRSSLFSCLSCSQRVCKNTSFIPSIIPFITYHLFYEV